MIIVLWLTTAAAFLAATIFLLLILFNNKHRPDFLKTFINGFRNGLSGSGLKPSRLRYPVELWVWETLDDDDVCEDCLERSTWPPMDIADWMREGLPGTPESETECCQNCRCRLVRYHPKKTYNPFHK